MTRRGQAVATTAKVTTPIVDMMIIIIIATDTDTESGETLRTRMELHE
jgi:hypothetical protein